jgi:hypothetical protein
MRVSGLLHTLAALPSGKEPPHYLLNRELGWTIELVWVLWGKEKSHAPTWYPIPFPRVFILQRSHCNSHILPPYESLGIFRVLFLDHCIAPNTVLYLLMYFTASMHHCKCTMVSVEMHL